MPETVTVPVVGKMKQSYLLVGGALLVGIVGYAYWSRGTRGGPTEVSDPGGVTLGEGTPPTVVDSNLDLGEPVDIIDSNAEWTVKAVEYLTSVGYEPLFAAATLGKWLARRPLTVAETDLVLTARAAMGDPPHGGPYALVPTTDPVDGPKPEVPYKEAVKLAKLSAPANPREYIATLSAGSGATEGTIITLHKKTMNDIRNLKYRGMAQWPRGASIWVHYAVKK